MNTKKLLITQFIRVSFLSVFAFISLVALQTTNKIETVVCDNETASDTTNFILRDNNFEIKGSDTKFVSGYFQPYDLSKTVYRINLTDKPIDIDHWGLLINCSTEALEFSPINNGKIGGSDVLILSKHPNKKSDISFYTKNLSGENKQFIRNFFLTEFICFLIGLLFLETRKIWTLRCRNFNTPHLCLSLRRNYKILICFYIIATISLGYLILRINVIKTEYVNTSDYKMNLNKEIFSLYDISMRKFVYELSPNQIENGKIKWSSSEIVEFPLIAPKEIKRDMNSIEFTPDIDGWFKRSFIVQNIESKNYQDIRIFILTTLFALSFSQLLVAAQKLIKKK